MNPFTDFQIQFFERIKLKPRIIESLDDISDVMVSCSKVFSFENLDIICNTQEPLTKKVLIKQVITNKQGGLCYKANTLLYYFLLEFGFYIHQTRATCENQESHTRWNISHGHMINILNFENKFYVIDVAFGCNLSLRPVPVTDNGNEIIQSCVGLYRTLKKENIVAEKYHYTHILEHRKPDTYLNESAKIWVIGYAFDPLLICKNDHDNCDENTETITHQTQIQQLVIDDPNKDFCVKPLATKLINNNNNNNNNGGGDGDSSDESIATLTLNSFTLTNCKTGEKMKTNFDNNKLFEQFNQHLISIFNLPPLKTVPLVFLIQPIIQPK
ncbi:hypothetical protein RB653_008564 [Dictyostelium firmibasis]|uniref:arylamine N-acetyltransferase n=1 Tax=Dictyostelium firmibasis TaxID=79012 RepID=A0AAN7TSS4_9MYCE